MMVFTPSFSTSFTISIQSILHAHECQASAETRVRHQPKLCKASAEGVLSPISRIRTKKGQPTVGFEPTTRCLQIRIYTVRWVPLRVRKCRFVFGCRKFRANRYRQVPTGGHESGGILVVRVVPLTRTFI
jgi:hypothetical protein